MKKIQETSTEETSELCRDVIICIFRLPPHWPDPRVVPPPTGLIPGWYPRPLA
ncbi:MAG: hypothetical protein K9J25_02760 [Bacteroidales bacterium]|nr:hypothetical protein [Bacteroidales bacterium]